MNTYNPYYQQRIEHTVDLALQAHPRTLVLRVDLRLPGIPASSDAAVISRFTESLKAKIRAHQLRKHQQGLCVHRTTLRYVWVKEVGPVSGKRHYHALLLLNKDAWCTPGDYQSATSLAGLIKQAWCSALRLNYADYATLVHFPVDPALWVDSNSPDYITQRTAVTVRASYLAKDFSKCYGGGERSFGCSMG